MEEKNTSFYMIFLEDGNTPVYKHQNLESAVLEAKRLVKTTQKKAFILCSIKSIELEIFKIEDLRPDNTDLPF